MQTLPMKKSSVLIKLLQNVLPEDPQVLTSRCDHRSLHVLLLHSTCMLPVQKAKHILPHTA